MVTRFCILLNALIEVCEPVITHKGIFLLLRNLKHPVFDILKMEAGVISQDHIHLYCLLIPLPTEFPLHNSD